MDTLSKGSVDCRKTFAISHLKHVSAILHSFRKSRPVEFEWERLTCLTSSAVFAFNCKLK